MKIFLLIACLFGTVSLMGCVSTQTTTTTPTLKDHAKPNQSGGGTYYRTGIGLGVVAF